jgi:hypothetical protein
LWRQAWIFSPNPGLYLGVRSQDSQQVSGSSNNYADAAEYTIWLDNSRLQSLAVGISDNIGMYPFFPLISGIILAQDSLRSAVLGFKFENEIRKVLQNSLRRREFPKGLDFCLDTIQAAEGESLFLLF